MYNWHDRNKNNLRTIEAKIVQKLKNEARPKFTCSYKKKRVSKQCQRNTQMSGIFFGGGGGGACAEAKF